MEKRIIDALKIVKQECEKHEECKDCQLKCEVALHAFGCSIDCVPAAWELEEGE